MNHVQMTARIVDGSQFETIRYPTDEILVRVADQGNVQVVEFTSVDVDGPPAHSHEWDEIEYVIEGNVEFYVNGAWTAAGPGSVQVLPAGAAHSVRVPSGSARLLMITVGPPYDGFARDLAALYVAGGGLDAVVATANRHGVRLEGDSAG